jgi:hypothetical protein
MVRATVLGGSGTANQGFEWRRQYLQEHIQLGGGGGGAGAVGFDVNTGTGGTDGDGGAGLCFFNNWVCCHIEAGGGGGGNYGCW